MIEYTDAEDGSGLNKPCSAVAVFPAQSGVSRRVVVQADDDGAIGHDGGLEDFKKCSVEPIEYSFH